VTYKIELSQDPPHSFESRTTDLRLCGHLESRTMDLRLCGHRDRPMVLMVEPGGGDR
jgi:hypothetical protein